MNTEDKAKYVLDGYKESIKKMVEDSFTATWNDYLPHIESDTQANVAHQTQRAINNLLRGDFSESHGNSSSVDISMCDEIDITVTVTNGDWDNIRKNLIKVMPKCPKDLELLGHSLVSVYNHTLS